MAIGNLGRMATNAAPRMAASHMVSISTNGRVVIPHPIRAAHGWADGDDLMLIETRDGVLMGTPQELARAIQTKFHRPGESVTDQFISERRAEANREAQK
jgi:AbrB family looped-hinge helix DNA binding protein